MAVDPFVASRLENAPRANPAPGPAFRWRAERPGDLVTPQVRAELFGSPGPDLGYALTLALRFASRLRLAEHEHRADADAVAAEIGMRRAAEFGRAPTAADVEFGFTVLGYLGDAPADLIEWRRPRVRGAAHDYHHRRVVVNSVTSEALGLPLDTARNRVASDWRSLFVEAPTEAPAEAPTEAPVEAPAVAAAVAPAVATAEAAAEAAAPMGGEDAPDA